MIACVCVCVVTSIYLFLCTYIVHELQSMLKYIGHIKHSKWPNAWIVQHSYVWEYVYECARRICVSHLYNTFYMCMLLYLYLYYVYACGCVRRYVELSIFKRCLILIHLNTCNSKNSWCRAGERRLIHICKKQQQKKKIMKTAIDRERDIHLLSQRSTCRILRLMDFHETNEKYKTKTHQYMDGWMDRWLDERTDRWYVYVRARVCVCVFFWCVIA